MRTLGGFVYIRLLACALLLTGCSPDAADPDPPPATFTTSTPPVKEIPSRSVRLSGGLALSYVHPETASRILCTPFTPHPVLVRFEPDVTGRSRFCRITDERGSKTVDLTLKQARTEVFTGHAKIGDRQVNTYDDVGDTVVFELPIAEIHNIREVSGQWPVLLAKTRRENHQLARDYLGLVLPELTKPTDQIPMKPGERPSFVPAPLTPDVFHDLAAPLQALQLCTFVQETFGHPVAWITEDQCNYRLPDGKTASIGVDGTGRILDEYERTVAGRPASFHDRSVRVRLRDDVPVDLTFPQDQDHIGERVVGALVPK